VLADFGAGARRGCSSPSRRMKYEDCTKAAVRKMEITGLIAYQAL
jgi:hypothetical protein